MDRRSCAYRFTYVIVLIISLVVINSIIDIKNRRIGIYQRDEKKANWFPLLNCSNVCQSLSVYLIENQIYPRYTNLTRNNSYNNMFYPLFVTIADSFYIEAVRNFQFQLKKFDLDKNLIVICLDVECINLSRSKNLFAWWGLINSSVARIKFDIIVDLAQSGFDFLLFDSDVFLSSNSNLLSFLNHSENTSWDIQFQLDENNQINGRINIGWFWARPSQRTIRYFIQSKQKWKHEGEWDQAVMNQILTKLENLSKSRNTSDIISIKRLPAEKFLNFMLTNWFRDLSTENENQTNVYSLDEKIRYNLIENSSKQAVIWHYTCVEKPLKILFGKYFGQWTNLDGYYTNKRKFLFPKNLGYASQNNQILLIQFLIAIKVALISQRTLVFPEIVLRYPMKRFPALRTFSISEIQFKQIDYVEATFFYNRKMKHNIDIPTTSTCHFSSKNNETLVNLTKRLIQQLDVSFKSNELVILDFAQFNHFNELLKIQNFDQWWLNSIMVNDRENINLTGIRLCKNINDKHVPCLRICT